MNFYDIALGRNIVCVHGVRHLLYMLPPDQLSSDEDVCVFDKYGCFIDFADARSQPSTQEIHPKNQESIPKGKDFKIFEHQYVDE